MKIVKIRALKVSMPFRRPFVVWRGVAKTKDHAIVLVETDEGITGIGEASPFLYYAPETQEDVISTIDHYISPLLEGKDPFQIEVIDDLFHKTIDGHHFSKAAVEMALWDIMGKTLGVPLYKLLGGKFHETVPLVAILQSGEPGEMAREAEDWVSKGFQQFKVKIGFGPEKDVAKVAAVRRAVGDKITIRVDAEESYDLKGSLAVAHRLRDLDIELFSQPIFRHNYHDMAVLRKSIDVPLLLDESIITPEDVLLATRLETGDLINIKVVKSGGILNSKRMAAIAKAAGKDCLVGSMLEMGPGTIFAGHFAISTANVTYASEIVGPLLLTDDILTEPVVINDGALHLPDLPGLGIELDGSKMKMYSR
jgi:L-alanine-DL-glutamate epimerase-like enolase superfamily enzyme